MVAMAQEKNNKNYGISIEKTDDGMALAVYAPIAHPILLALGYGVGAMLTSHIPGHYPEMRFMGGVFGIVATLMMGTAAVDTRTEEPKLNDVFLAFCPFLGCLSRCVFRLFQRQNDQ